MKPLTTVVRAFLVGLCLCLACGPAAAYAAPPAYYTVREGDTLYDVGQRYGVSVGALTVANALQSSQIAPGQVLIVPDQLSLVHGNVTPEDLHLLAQIIHAEARGESITGKVAVGAVILNRLASPDFPPTLKEIIFEKTSHNVYQFSPVADGSIYLTPDETAYRAARLALMGEDPTNGALFFYNPVKASDTWIRTLPVVTEIGNHVFAVKA